MRSDEKRKGNKQTYIVCVRQPKTQRRSKRDCRSFACARWLYLCYQRTRNGEKVFLLPKNESNGGTSREVVVDVNRRNDAVAFIFFSSSLCSLFLIVFLQSIHTYIYILVFICSSILDVAVFFFFRRWLMWSIWTILKLYVTTLVTNTKSVTQENE